jgi:hypothetical protein
MLIRIRLAILMPIQLRVWIPDWHQIMRSKCGSFPKFYTFWKIGTKLCYFYSQQWQIQNISFHMSGKCVMILSILDSILKFSLKSKNYMCLELISIGWIRIGMPWIPILIRILQNYADLTLSGSGNIR